MAIGDAVVVFLGTAATNRQPSSGVEEQIVTYVKPDQTDAINVYDGTTALEIIAANRRTDLDYNVATGAGSQHPGGHNSSEMITNAVYLRKSGTSDRIGIGGVQTNV